MTKAQIERELKSQWDYNLKKYKGTLNDKDDPCSNFVYYGGLLVVNTLVSKFKIDPFFIQLSFEDFIKELG